MGKGIVKLGEGQWAVKDGNLLAAKETNGRFKNAEFTVTRGSDATYVDRDGLIKQTSSNIESEVFLNPNFDDTITLGNAGSGWSDSGLGEVTFYNEGLKITGEGVGTAKARAKTATNSSAILETSRLYELTYTIKSISSKSNTLSLYMAGNTHTITQKSVGTHTILVASGTNVNKIFQFQWYQTDNESIVFSSVSLKESIIINGAFTTDSDWSGTGSNGISISGGKINFNNTPYASNSSQFNVTTVGKTYKVVFTVSNYVKGNVRMFLGGSATPKAYGNGTYTSYVTASSNTSVGLQLLNASGTTLSVDNVSVFEINNGALPRIDFTNNTDGHLLLEPQSTNLLTYSQEFDHSSGYWNTPNTTIETTSITSPDGSNDTYKLFANTGSSSHYFDNINYSGASSGQTYTYSVFVKSAGSDFIQLASSSGFPARYQNFNLSTGAKASGDISNATIEAYPNGWYRISVTETTNGTSRRFLIVPVLTDNSRNPVFVGNPQEDGVYIFGAQLEELSYATSYIPTNGSTVTRDAETCTGSGEAIDFNSEEGVLYAEIARNTVHNDYELLSISPTNNSDGTHYASLGYNNTDNKLWIRAKIGNTVAIASIGEVDTVLNQFYKIAIKYKSGENAIFVDGQKLINTDITDGSETTTFTATPNTISDLEFRHWDANNSFYGKVKAIRVYKEALSNSELVTLTSL